MHAADSQEEICLLAASADASKADATCATALPVSIVTFLSG